MCALNLMSQPNAVLQFAILPLLNVKDLCRIGITCKKFSNLSSDPSLWSPLLQTKYSDYFAKILEQIIILKDRKAYKRFYGEFTIISRGPRKFSSIVGNNQTRKYIKFDALVNAATNGFDQALTIITNSLENPSLIKNYFFTAAAWGDDKLVTEFFKHKIDVNTRDERQMTALHNNGMNGSKKCIVPLLIAAGADPNLRDQDGQTPLHWAVRNGNTQAVRDLVKAGANKEIRDNNGKTPEEFGLERVRQGYSKMETINALRVNEPIINPLPIRRPEQNLLTRIINFIKSIFQWIQSKIKSCFHTLQNQFRRM